MPIHGKPLNKVESHAVVRKNTVYWDTHGERTSQQLETRGALVKAMHSANSLVSRKKPSSYNFQVETIRGA